MKETFRAIREWKWLLVGACALVLGTLAVPAQNPNASQTPAASQSPAPQTQRAQAPAPSPTPTPVNWSDDPMLKRFVFRGIGPASMGGRVDDIASVEGNPYIYYVGLATGGIWKTTNNGTTFTPIFDTYSTASIGDIAIAPSNPDIVWVGTGEASNRQSSSFGDGIYKSTDAGKSFTKMGLENSQSIARIVIDPKDPNIVYAQIEVGASTGTGGEEQTGPNPQASPTPTPTAPDPKKSGVWRSDDKGKTWRVVATCFNANNCTEDNRPMYYTQIRVDPSNPENVFVGGLNFSRSTDGGKTFKSLQPGIVHSDHHAIWIDPKNGKHLRIGNDGGLDVSYDQGDTWEFVNTIVGSQFYAIAAAMRNPYYVYGGLQDNGSWAGPSQTRNPTAGIINADWFRIGGGDGFYAQADPSDPYILYSESQNGNMSRIDLRTGRSQSIRPRVAQRRGAGGRGPGGGGSRG